MQSLRTTNVSGVLMIFTWIQAAYMPVYLMAVVRTGSEGSRGLYLTYIPDIFLLAREAVERLHEHDGCVRTHEIHHKIISRYQAIPVSMLRFKRPSYWNRYLKALQQSRRKQDICHLHGRADIEQEADPLRPVQYRSPVNQRRARDEDRYTDLSWGRPISGLAIPRRLYTVASPVRPSVSLLSSSSPSVWRLTQTRSSSRAARSTV